MSPFFSITIPAYNRAYILPETIISIQNQTFTNWEVIIVDDGSSDNTKEVVETLMESDPRIRYVYQENSERSAARNNGADHAYGDYLLFLDSDDAFREDHLEKLHQLFERKNFPVAMAFTHVAYLTDKGLEIPALPTMAEGNAFEYLLLQPITPSRVCIHRDILKVFRFDPAIVIVEDLVLWVCIASRYPVFQLTEYTSVYRIHGGNSVDLSRNSYHNRYEGLLRLFNHPDYAEVSAKIPTSIKKFLLAECSFNMARHFEFVKNYKQMNRMLFRSFTHQSNYRNKERAFLFLSHFPLTQSMLIRKEKRNG